MLNVEINNFFPDLVWYFQNAGDMDPEQAKRIFRGCDQVGRFCNWYQTNYYFIQDGDHKITLLEFKTMANSNSGEAIVR